MWFGIKSGTKTVETAPAPEDKAAAAPLAPQGTLFAGQRHAEATRQISAVLADLVDVERHNEVRRRLLQIIAQATGYSYALLSEMESTGGHMQVTGLYIPSFLVQQIEHVLDFELLGYRFVNEPSIALQTPPTERFRHIHQWRPDVSRPLGVSIETILGIREIVAIRLHTGQHYLGAVTFVATNRNVDLPLLEYLCNNALVYAIRLMQEQVARAALQASRTQELEQEILERKQVELALRASEEAILKLHTITANQQMDFAQKVQALLAMGCQRFGMEAGILSHITGDRYTVMQVYAPLISIKQGDEFALADTYSRETVKTNGPISFAQVADSQWVTHPGYAQFAIEAYLGTPVTVMGEEGAYTYGTLSFFHRTPRTGDFRPSDEQFLRLMAQWIGSELDRATQTQTLRAYAHAIEQTNQELAIARDRALEVSRLKSEFLATMSHEIRTPMNSVLGMTELLLDTPLDTRQKEFATIVMAEGEHLLSIINDILDFSKIEAGKVLLEEQPFIPSALVGSVVDLLNAQAQAKGLSLQMWLDPALPALLVGDSGRLRQVLINLVGNAVKFTERGKVLVRLTVRQPQTDEVTLYGEVIDTGIGISTADQARLFQPFTQVDSGATRRHGGTGLGLSIAHRLIRLMGGELAVQSTVGEGSTFWFTVPLRRLKEAAPAPAALQQIPVLLHAITTRLEDKTEEPSSTAAEPPLATAQVIAHEQPAAPLALPAPVSPTTILLVEDQEYNRMVATEQLSKLGLGVDWVANGQEACAKLLQPEHGYQLVLMDCQMPLMDGLEATRQIRAYEAGRRCHTPLIAMTAQAMTSDEARCRAAGFDDYLRKPVRLQELQRVLQRWLTPE